jgi:hypothetical protein
MLSLHHHDAPRPLLMIVGTDVVTAWMTTDAFANAQEPKELFWGKGATQVALYDKQEYVTLAVSRLAEFFRNGLYREPVACAARPAD